MAVKVPPKTAAKTSAKSSVNSAAKTPAKSAVKTPAKSAAKRSAKSVTKAPAKPAAQAPAQSPVKSAAKKPTKRATRKATGKATRTATGSLAKTAANKTIKRAPGQPSRPAKERAAASPRAARSAEPAATVSMANSVNEVFGASASDTAYVTQEALAQAARAQEPITAFASWVASSPEFMSRYLRYLGDSAELWRAQIESTTGSTEAKQAVANDRRFSAPEWSSNPYFDFLRQSYLLTAQFLTDSVDAADLEEHGKGQLRFLARQYLDAISPANFVATNPEALRAALDSGGETVARGITHFLEDLSRGRISTVDESAFAVGRNLALTPGAVVFENALFQLIQYSAATPTVYQRPLLIVPPCINKFYILDLSPENSFVAHAVASGHTVFVVSWRNPQPADLEPAAGQPSSEPALDKARWDDFVELGVIKAIEAVQAISGEPLINALGFCVGGTMLSTALAVLAARGERPVASLTLLATLLDFSDTGELGLFVDEESVSLREATLGKGGLLNGRELAQVFSALRDNDLIWSYVVNNYLKGKKPAAFDILYWNADSTNLPGPMYAWYMRNMYLENQLREPGALQICGEPVDLTSIAVPTYLVATREDHIVPWQSAYASAELLVPMEARASDDQPAHRTSHLLPTPRFVLGASGHIAGIVNPASANKRNYRVGQHVPSDPNAWLAASQEVPGSWWTDWLIWLAGHAGVPRIAPRSLGGAGYRPIEPAPGRYVMQRSE